MGHVNSSFHVRTEAIAKANFWSFWAQNWVSSATHTVAKNPKARKTQPSDFASSTTIGTYTIHSTVGEKRVYVHREKCAFSRADSFGSMRKVEAKALVAFLLFFILRLAAFPMILHGEFLISKTYRMSIRLCHNCLFAKFYPLSTC